MGKEKLFFTKSISKVRQGDDSFFVSLIFTDFAVPDTFKALNVLATFSITQIL